MVFIGCWSKCLPKWVIQRYGGRSSSSPWWSTLPPRFVYGPQQPWRWACRFSWKNRQRWLPSLNPWCPQWVSVSDCISLTVLNFVIFLFCKEPFRMYQNALEIFSPNIDRSAITDQINSCVVKYLNWNLNIFKLLIFKMLDSHAALIVSLPHTEYLLHLNSADMSLFVFTETDPRAPEAFHVQEWNQCPKALALICETAWEGKVYRPF